MATQVQFRRGTTAQTALFLGAAGEIIIDTQANTISVQDGVTRGGTYLAKQNDMLLGFSKSSSNTANISLVANAAYSQANIATTLAQSFFDSANTLFSEIEQDLLEIAGVDSDQNSRILIANTTANYANTFANVALINANAALSYATDALLQINVASTNANTALNSITYISGVDVTQNTNINLAKNLAQSAYDRANTIPSSNGIISATAIAQAAYNQGNSTAIFANTGISLAQAAFNAANSASRYANSVFGGSF